MNNTVTVHKLAQILKLCDKYFGLSTFFYTIFIRSIVVCIELVFDNQENHEF